MEPQCVFTCKLFIVFSTVYAIAVNWESINENPQSYGDFISRSIYTIYREAQSF